MKLLTSDWHLDDNPDNEYRWEIIDHVIKAMREYEIREVFNLGDFVDKKDRHSAVFVNRLLSEIDRITAIGSFFILRGNHDTPLRGPAFWEFANAMEGFQYITEPEVFGDGDLLLLPYHPDPFFGWKDLGLKDYKALFMHATYPGAVVEGFALEGSNLPMLPRHSKIYSGDVHTPQTLRNFVHVGAPHPVKFGDTYKCRMLVLDEDYDIHKEIILHPPQKAVVVLSSIADLKTLKNLKAGDQVHIRFNLDAEAVDQWGVIEGAIATWAKETGVTVARTEALVTAPGAGADLDPEVSPEALLRDFAVQEKLTEEMLQTGLDLLKEASR